MITHVTESEVFRALLIQLSYASATQSAAWGITIYKMQDKPDNHFTVYDTTPVKHARLGHTGRTSQHYGVQLRIRSADRKVGKLKGREIAKAMDAVARLNVTVGAYTVMVKNVITVNGATEYIGQEEQNQRHVHTMNFLLDLTESGEGVGE